MVEIPNPCLGLRPNALVGTLSRPLRICLLSYALPLQSNRLFDQLGRKQGRGRPDHHHGGEWCFYSQYGHSRVQKGKVGAL